MRKKKYFCILLAVSQMLILTNCSNDDWQLPRNEVSQNAISVSEAKAFFEEQMMQNGNTSNSWDLGGFATHFTPQWKLAVINGRDSMMAVDVPIVADLTFLASSQTEGTQKERFEPKMMQKLVVVKNLRTNQLGAYVATLIPDRDYALSRKEMSAMDFTNYGDYGNFSGRIIYSLPLSTVPLRVNLYREGQLTDAGAYFGVRDNPDEMQAAAEKMKELLSGFDLIRGAPNMLRSEEFYGGELPEVIVTPPPPSLPPASYYSPEPPAYYPPTGGNSGYSPDPGYNGGISGGSGGGNNGSKTPEPRTDCPAQAATNSNLVNNVLNSTYGDDAQVKSNVDLLRNYAKNSSNEYVLTVEKNGSQYTLLDQNGNNSYIKGGANTSANQGFTNNTYLLAHTHPGGSGYIMSPSPADAVTLASAYKGKPGQSGLPVEAKNIQGSVIFGADGSEYMIYVNDRTALSTFCSNSQNSSFFENTGSDFKTNSIFASTYTATYNNIKTQGYSNDDANSYALAYVLDYYHTGLKISKKEPGKTDFKEQKTEGGGIGINYSPKICP